MKGQWLGSYGGTNNGSIMLDIDDCGDHFEGRVHVFDDAGLPGTVAFIRTENQKPSQTLELQLAPLHPTTAEMITRDQLSQSMPAFVFPKTATVTCELKDETLHVSWSTEVGTHGSAELPRSKSDQPSEYRSQEGIKSWSDFKSYAVKLEPGRFIFRGQTNIQRLRTAFHRTNRKDLITYMWKDIPALHRTLSAQTKHVFNLSDALQNGAFWNLIQHHGYPTPLLDWSESPFVAAFFAFRAGRYRRSDGASVRVFMFDRNAWCSAYNQLQKVAPAKPHFSILQALAIENQRALPQQALSSVTNVDDIETYISLRETERATCYLQVFDLPYVERESVLRELGMMGITAGSLFPGLDGACEELRARFFGYEA